MVFFPNCKINLGLHITRKRPDDYHDLETVFYPLPFYDVLEVIQVADVLPNNIAENNSLNLAVTGLPINSLPDENICVKAYKLLKKDFTNLLPLQVHLHKTIPVGAGLGGGSADGAFMLKLLNKKFHLNLTTDQLINYALQLGSDCPFFIINKPCSATGRGEVLEEISIDLSGYSIVLVNPGIHISTQQAFSQARPAIPPKPVKEIISQPVDMWKHELKNDFEKIIFKNYAEVKAIKTTLYQNGAVYASMSGSGSTVYGLFKKGSLPHFNLPATYFVKIINH